MERLKKSSKTKYYLLLWNIFFQYILGFTQILVTKVAYLNIFVCVCFVLTSCYSEHETWADSKVSERRETKVGENSRVGWWSHVFLVRIKHCELWATWKLNKSCQRRGDHVDNSLMLNVTSHSDHIRVGPNNSNYSVFE